MHASTMSFNNLITPHRRRSPLCKWSAIDRKTFRAAHIFASECARLACSHPAIESCASLVVWLGIWVCYARMHNQSIARRRQSANEYAHMQAYEQDFLLFAGTAEAA